MEHVDLAGVPTTEDMKKKKEYDQTMLEIAFGLSYVKFNDIKGCTSAFKMCEALKNIYGGDQESKEKKERASRKV